MSENYIVTNKRIARNSLILYTKLILNIVLGLITSRFVLQALGASNYGLYNVVAGILTMIMFVSSSMSETTTRYINFEVGKNGGDVNKVFNTCNVIHIFLAVIVLVLAETIGVYYVKNILKVTSGMEGVAMLVFQISTISGCFAIMNAPYQGLIVAKENFLTMAKVEIFNISLKLVFVLSLFLFLNNRLSIYAIYMACLTLVLFGSYHWICHKRWPEIVKWQTKEVKKYSKEILTFNNYNLLASGAQLLKEQGANMLINYFYGTIVNAAYSIAYIVQNYIASFMSSFGFAAAPQITQNISRGNYERAINITTVIGKTCLIMAMIAVFPILVETGFILQLWLGEIPPYTITFVKLMLILAIVGASSSGVAQIINGIGKIKWFKIPFATLCLFSLLIVGIAFKHNASPTIILQIFISIEIINRIIQLYLLNKIVKFDSIKFVKQAYLRPMIIALVTMCLIYLLHLFMPISNLCKIINILIVLISTLILSFYIGFSKTEQEWILRTINEKLHLF